MNNRILKFQIFILIVIQLRKAKVRYCEQINNDGQTCDQFQNGFNMEFQTENETTLNQNLCRASCEEYSYLQEYSLENLKCSSICNSNQIGDDITRTCETLNQCPQSFEFGQQFHSGEINNIILFPNNSLQKVEEIITSSLQDNRIMVWNSENGELRVQLKGHTSNILKLFILPLDISEDFQQLLSFSEGGEIFIWNYNHGSQILSYQVNQGQLTLNSEINFNMKLIISFGFQGEFFLINYQTFNSKKFIGHQNIVEQVNFVGNNHLISTSKDKKIILWNINDQDNPLILKILQVQKINIYPIKFNSSFDQYFIFILAKDEDKSFTQFQLGNLSNGNNDVIKESKEFKLLKDNDNLTNLTNFIIDNKNNYFITHSTKFILIYQLKLVMNQYQLILNERILSSSLFLGINNLIQKCVLFNNKFIIGNNNGEIQFFEFKIIKQQNESFLQPEKDNIFKVERITDTSQLHFQFSEYDNTLYISHNFLISLGYQNRKIKFIINNWLSPLIRHKGIALDIIQGFGDSQLLCSISTDGTAFVYDFITENLLNIFLHPENTIGSIKIPVAVSIVSDINVCVSYDDYSVICFDPLTIEINFKYKNNKNETYYYLNSDNLNNYLVAAGLNLIDVFDLSTYKQFSTFSKQNQFYYVYYTFLSQQIYSSTKEGYYIRFNFPDLTINKEVDYSYINTNQQKIIGWNNDMVSFMASVTFYDKGLILILNKDLSLIKQLQENIPVTQCGVIYPKYVVCVDQVGNAVLWSIFTDYKNIKQGLEFPIKIGRVSLYGFFIMHMDLAAFGSGILVAELSQITATQTISMQQKIQTIEVEDVRMRVFATMTTGEISDYHFTYEPAKLIDWKPKDSDQKINRLIIIENSNKIIILSKSITIYDYLDQKIFKVQQYHETIVTGSLIDNKRNIIISFNNDTKKNLFIWHYLTDKINELQGHIDAVLGIVMQNDDGNIISFSQDGFIILWNYLTCEALNKLNLHESAKVINLVFTQFSIGSKVKQLIISQGDNQIVSVYDLKSQEINVLIQVKDQNSTIKIDEQQLRIFIYSQNTIYVYSYFTGVQISTLLGFDGIIRNFIFLDNFIISTGEFMIFSFDRITLQQLHFAKSTQAIYQISILQDLVGIISNSLNDNIKLWNYKTGIMLEDMINRYYSSPINGIMADKDAKLFLVKNIQNQIFSFNPFSTAFSKVSDYMVLPIFNQNLIKDILIDYQSNLFFAYNDDQIMIEKYYCMLGSKGQEKALPQKDYSLVAQSKTNGKYFYFIFQQTK